MDGAFTEVDFAQLVKIYTESGHRGRYSPAECIGCIPKPISGTPEHPQGPV